MPDGVGPENKGQKYGKGPEKDKAGGPLKPLDKDPGYYRTMNTMTGMADPPDIAFLVFFLGGRDLEMETIAALLEDFRVSFHDKHLAWGAKASDYRNEINAALDSDLTPVLVELQNDMSFAEDRVISIDHHGLRAGADRPTSLHQVFALLGLPPERWIRRFELVAANDRGYIPGMIDLGATQNEIVEIRAADRRAQGITDEQERQGKEAIKAMEVLFDGGLILVRLAHSRMAVVSDKLHPGLGGPGYRNLLVVSPGEVNFDGEGRIVKALYERFGGWCGGALPERGFWGHGKPLPDVLSFLFGCFQRGAELCI